MLEVFHKAFDKNIYKNSIVNDVIHDQDIIYINKLNYFKQ